MMPFAEGMSASCRLLLDKITVIIAMVDEKMEIKFINSFGCNLLQKNENEIIGKNWFDVFFSANHPASLRLQYPKVLVEWQNYPECYEIPILIKDGQERFISWSASKIQDEQGRTQGILTIGADVTEYKKKEFFLFDTKEHLQNILDSVADPIFVTDRQHECILVNDAFCIFMGYSREEVIGKADSDFLSHRVIPGDKDELAFNSGKIIMDSEGEIVDAHGLTHTIRCKRQAYWNERGERFIVGAIRDITEQRDEERQLHEALQEWDTTFDAIEDMIFVMDQECVIIKTNDAFLRLLHATPEQLIGKKCHDLVHKLPSAWPGCPADMTKADKKSHTEEINDPSLGLSLLVTTSPIFDDAGNVIMIVHVAKDITEMKKIEANLRKKINDLERFQAITVDRELRMRELKAKIAELEEKLKHENRH